MIVQQYRDDQSSENSGPGDQCDVSDHTTILVADYTVNVTSDYYGLTKGIIWRDERFRSHS